MRNSLSSLSFDFGGRVTSALVPRGLPRVAQSLWLPVPYGPSARVAPLALHALIIPRAEHLSSVNCRAARPYVGARHRPGGGSTRRTFAHLALCAPLRPGPCPSLAHWGAPVRPPKDPSLTQAPPCAQCRYTCRYTCRDRLECAGAYSSLGPFAGIWRFLFIVPLVVE